MTSYTNKLNQTKKTLFPPSVKSGLYIITSISAKRHYIGESDTATLRLNAHKSALKRGIHSNDILQTDFANYSTNLRFVRRRFFV